MNATQHNRLAQAGSSMAVAAELGRANRYSIKRIASRGLTWAAFACAFIGAIGGAQAASSCTPLTIADLYWYVGGGNLAFRIDNEGTASAPLYFDLVAQSNTATGAFTGTMSTSSSIPAQGALFYAVNGTVTQVGASGLGISFTYSTWTANSVSWETYTYTGAIAVADGTCSPFLAGVYTATNYWVEYRPNGPITVPTLTSYSTGPLPFSAMMIEYLWL